MHVPIRAVIARYVVALGACLAVCAPASAATLTVRSGGLSAVVSTHPWSLRFVQAAGAGLDELTSTAPSPYGTLAFGSGPVPAWGGAPSTPPGVSWWHVTRAVKVTPAGGGVTLDLASNDPLGRHVSVSVMPAGAGVIAVRAHITGAGGVTQMADSFASSAGEHFSGFGGRENLVDQAGQTVEDWTEEGAWIPADRPFIPPFIEPWTYSTRDDGTYFPMAWTVSSHGYGLLVDDTERSLFRLRTDVSNAWDVEVDAAHLDYRVFAGPTPLAVVRRFSAAVGRQPAPAAPWVLGPWWQPTGSQGSALPARFRRQDVPGSLIMTYTHYLPCGGQVGRTTAERALVARIHAAGYAVTTYFNPMICFQYPTVFSQAQSAGALLNNRAGAPYPIHYNQYVVAEFDFTSPAGRTFYQRLLQEAIDNGYDGWMEDFGEYTPPDSLAHDGTPGSALHNVYPRLYHCAAYAQTARASHPVVQFGRSGWTGSARCIPVVWSGDPTTDWSFDGLPGMVSQGINYGYSGVGFYGSDIGGFFSIMAPPTTPELLARWLEVGAFSGVMRTEADGFVTPQWQTGRAQIWDPSVEPIWRRYAKLRTQLYPYIAAAAARYERTGAPLMEGLGLAYPSDPASFSGTPRYLFGPDLLVAPVVRQGARTASVPLPPGRWRNFWQAVHYRVSDGSFHLHLAPVLSGGRTANVSAPLDVTPLFVKDGTLLPMLAPDVATLASYGSHVVHLSNRSNLLHLLAWPRGRASVIALGTKLSSRISGKLWTLVVHGRRRLVISVEAALPWRARLVSFGGHWLGALRWRFTGGVLRVTLRGSGVLRVFR